jgi:multidrug resistance efflux pump
VGSIALAYAVWNAALVGGHLYRHRDDSARLDQLVQQVEAERAVIAELEAELTTLESELERSQAEFTGLGRWIDRVQSMYPQGIPSHTYDEYSAAVDRYNALVSAHNEHVGTFQSVQARYAAVVDSFNAHAEEANALAEEIGSIRDRLLLPLPKANPTRQ